MAKQKIYTCQMTAGERLLKKSCGHQHSDFRKAVQCAERLNKEQIKRGKPAYRFVPIEFVGAPSPLAQSPSGDVHTKAGGRHFEWRNIAADYGSIFAATG